MKRCFQEITLTRIFTVKQLEKLENKRLVDVALANVRVEIGTFDESEEEFVNDLEVGPGKFKDRFVFLWVKRVACRVDLGRNGPKQVCCKLQSRVSSLSAGHGAARKATYHANHFRVDAFCDDASLTRNVFEHLV